MLQHLTHICGKLTSTKDFAKYNSNSAQPHPAHSYNAGQKSLGQLTKLYPETNYFTLRSHCQFSKLQQPQEMNIELLEGEGGGEDNYNLLAQC